MVSLVIDNQVQNGFFKNSEFRSTIQLYVKKILSINVEITAYPSSREMCDPIDIPVKYAIMLLDEQCENQGLMQSVLVFMKNIFKTMQLQVLNDLTGWYYLLQV